MAAAITLLLGASPAMGQGPVPLKGPLSCRSADNETAVKLTIPETGAASLEVTTASGTLVCGLRTRWSDDQYGGVVQLWSYEFQRDACTPELPPALEAVFIPEISLDIDLPRFQPARFRWLRTKDALPCEFDEASLNVLQTSLEARAHAERIFVDVKGDWRAPGRAAAWKPLADGKKIPGGSEIRLTLLSARAGHVLVLAARDDGDFAVTLRAAPNEISRVLPGGVFTHAAADGPARARLVLVLASELPAALRADRVPAAALEDILRGVSWEEDHGMWKGSGIGLAAVRIEVLTK